jgi:hypothetical protein
MNYIKLLNAAFEKFLVDDRLHPTHISLYMALFQDWNSRRFADEIFVSRRDLMLVSKIGSKSNYHRCITDLHSWGYLSYFPSNSPYKGSKIQMTVFDTNDEHVIDHYSPILEQLADQYHPKNELVAGQYRPILEQVGQYHPKNEPVAGHYHPKNEPVTGQYSPILEQVTGHYHPNTGLSLGSNINNTKQVNNIKQKGCQAVFDFFIEKGFNADEGKKFFAYYETRNWQTSDGNEIRDWRALALNWMDRTVQFAKENNPNAKQVSHIKDNLRTTKSKDYGQPL